MTHILGLQTNTDQSVKVHLRRERPAMVRIPHSSMWYLVFHGVACLQAEAPLYVHHDVWNAACQPLEESTVYRLMAEPKGKGLFPSAGMAQQKQLLQQGSIANSSRGTGGGAASAVDYTLLRSV